LYDDDRLLQKVFFVNLFIKLANYRLIRDVWIGFGVDVHGAVFEYRDVRGELTDVFRGQFTFLCNAGGEFPRVILNILMWALISVRSFWRC